MQCAGACRLHGEGGSLAGIDRDVLGLLGNGRRHLHGDCRRIGNGSAACRVGDNAVDLHAVPCGIGCGRSCRCGVIVPHLPCPPRLLIVPLIAERACAGGPDREADGLTVRNRDGSGMRSDGQRLG